MITATSDLHLQEDPSDVLERSCNFAPDAGWHNKDDRRDRARLCLIAAGPLFWVTWCPDGKMKLYLGASWVVK